MAELDEAQLIAMARRVGIGNHDQNICARSKLVSVRWALAQNPSLTFTPAIRRLAHDKECPVRMMLAANRNIDSGTQISLSTDTDPRVRYALACNTAIGENVRDILRSDEDRDVAACVDYQPWKMTKIQ